TDLNNIMNITYKAIISHIKNGEKPGYPRYKEKGSYDSFTYPQARALKIEGKYLKLSKIGLVRIKLHRQIEGKIKTCTIRRKNGKYYACITCEIEQEQKPKTGKVVGVDLGVKHLAITSDGQFFPNHKYRKKSERKIKYLQRMVSRRKLGSNRRKKAVLLLAKEWEKVANRRKDLAHKISRKLVDNYDLIAFEDLN